MQVLLLSLLGAINDAGKDTDRFDDGVGVVIAMLDRAVEAAVAVKVVVAATENDLHVPCEALSS